MRGDVIFLLIRYEGEQVEDEMGGACGTYGEAIYVLCILHVHTIKGPKFCSCLVYFNLSLAIRIN